MAGAVASSLCRVSTTALLLGGEFSTLFDVGILFEYWRDHPTADEILKAVYKINARDGEPPDDGGAAADAGANRIQDFGKEYYRILADRERCRTAAAA